MKLQALEVWASDLGPSPLMPALFLGHGSPMNAIEDNEFVKGFQAQAQHLPRPKAILCISAHWETKGTQVTAMPMPRTIHDFGGFPKVLYEQQYPAPGSPELALQTQELLKDYTPVKADQHWGLDHGAWSVLKHLYPKADIPVIQLSLDYSQSPAYHFELGRRLSALRHKGILIVGSGNLVHNLGLVAWNRLNEAYAYDWALEASDKMRQYLLKGDYQALVNFRQQGKAFDLAIPTPEHYLPLLYILGLKTEKEALSLFNDKPLAGSLTMTSVKIGS